MLARDRDFSLNIENDNRAAFAEEHLLLVRIRRVVRLVQAEAREAEVVLARDDEEYGNGFLAIYFLALERKVERNLQILRAA